MQRRLLFAPKRQMDGSRSNQQGLNALDSCFGILLRWWDIGWNAAPVALERWRYAMIVKEIDREGCIAVLAASRVARLACCKDGQPYAVPIHYAFDDQHLYSFSMPGQKIEWMRANPLVCVQVDDLVTSRDWRSVVVYGVYEELRDRIGWKRERDRAWSLLEKHANWWEPGSLKPVRQPVAPGSSHLFYRIKITSVTGRQTDEDNLSL
ncbi:pyridoxamine 5'-phosphate oxidase family protein [Pseudaminobacter sp. NGMCC 1.201702]|uniref:pyridoxamine 5'-phosphate oxidase family protein n=1 Tax=Pseudaminobacter sp. NGMCC 1.201702 TaxID=3391825 RepID=UPI0039F04C1B